MKKIYRLLLEIALIIGLLLVIREMYQLHIKYEAVMEDLEIRTQANGELKKLNSDYEKSLVELRKVNNDLASFYFSEFHQSKLEAAGIGSPQELFENLSAQSSKIKVDGIHGSMYYFISGKPLKTNWYIADFEDGYQTGTMLLSYSVSNGNIDWQPLEIVLD